MWCGRKWEMLRKLVLIWCEDYNLLSGLNLFWSCNSPFLWINWTFLSSRTCVFELGFWCLSLDGFLVDASNLKEHLDLAKSHIFWVSLDLNFPLSIFIKLAKEILVGTYVFKSLQFKILLSQIYYYFFPSARHLTWYVARIFWCLWTLVWRVISQMMKELN